MRYRMDDDTVVDTDKATQTWEEATFWDGRNHISKATSDQWTHQTLYRSRKGRYYLVHTSQWQGSRDYAEWIGNHVAAAWLTVNDHAIPEELAAVAEDVTE